LSHISNVLVEVAIKENVCNGHLVLFGFCLFSSAQQPFVEEWALPQLGLSITKPHLGCEVGYVPKLSSETLSWKYDLEWRHLRL
jgi:hypothetical protein